MHYSLILFVDVSSRASVPVNSVSPLFSDAKHSSFLALCLSIFIGQSITSIVVVDTVVIRKLFELQGRSQEAFGI